MSQTTVSAPRLSGPAQQLDDYLQQQMRKASAQVRLVDLFTSIMTLLAVFLGALFLIALVDAWIFELKPWMRASALGLIIVSAIAYTLIVIVPLSIRKINPVYAAKVVESARPDIKNGLINYLLLRSFGKEEKAVSQRVIELVGSRAANDISGVEVAGTVDKTNTIRIAMVLVVIVTVLGLYKVFSPKDPFQTFARVMAPFSDMARPARVRITEVTPGNTTVYFGQPMPVTARVEGRFDEESVFLVYSTTDGQVIGERLSMRPSESGDGTYVVLLKTDDRGIGHSLDYHIEAGDGESAEYSMILKSTPMLSVDSIKYEPPAYTRLQEQTVTGTSEISALEGTLVTLNTVANTQLQSATVVLLNQRPDAQFDVVNKMSMTIIDSKRAECKFRLKLDNNRQGQQYSHYQLNLSTVEGKTGEPAAPCPIRVIPDLAPEIQVLEPTDTELSVPINSKIRFIVRSQDADFELSKISVVGNSSVYEVFDQDIPLPRDADLSGQVNVRFDLWPKKLRMREGETVMVTFSAFDNRCIATNNAPEPNRTPSVNYMVTVTPAIENPPADEPEDEPEQGDKDNDGTSEDSKPSDDEQNNPDAKNDKDTKGSQNENDDSKAENESDPNNDSPADSESGADDKEEKDSSPDGKPGEDSKSGEKENKKQDDKQSSDSKETSKDGKEGDPNGGTADDSESKSEDGKSGNAQKGTGGNSSPDDKNDSGSKSGEPGDQNNSDPNGSQSSSDSPAAGSESSAGAANPDGTEQPGRTGASDQPGEPLGDDAAPGDIIDKVNQIREQQEKSGSGSKPKKPDSGQPNQGENKDDNKAGDQNKSGSESDSNGGDDKSKPDSADAGSKQEDKPGGGSDKEQTEQNSGQDNKPSDEGDPSSSKDTGKKGSNEESPSSGGASDEKGDDKRGESKGGGESGDKPEDQETKPDEKPGSGGGDDQKQKSSGDSGSKDDSGKPEQSDPSQPSENSKGKDGDSDKGEPGESGSPESGGSEQGGIDPEQDGSQKSGSPESGTGAGEQKGSPEGSSPGSPGDQPGSQGSEKESQQPAGSGDSPGDQPGDSPSSQPGDGQSSDGTGTGDNNSSPQGGSNAGGQPGGGSPAGNSSGGNGKAPPPTNSANAADAANLEYTKKATDLALDYLTQQQVNPDPELLEQLNWTEDELRDFVKRWNELRQRAESGDADARQKYDQELRSLGIGPNKAEVQQTKIEQDKQTGYQEDGRVSNAPDGFRAFEKRRNRVDEKQPPR